MPRVLERHLLLLPVAALLAITPLLAHGVSCGHDLGFHTLSWLDAASQLRHGHYPHWATTPAWNAGEPRFVFYPPLSWLLGALLTLIVPVAAAPVLYLYLSLVAAGFAMHRLAFAFATPNAALLAAILYLANPYMLFNAFERSALAELLASAWMPLLLLALLRRRPTVRGIALPLALLWLTNAPAAVMGSYLVALIATGRVVLAVIAGGPERSEGPASPPRHNPLRLILTYLTATLFGLALPAFYLLPAAYERRYVQVAMAIIPNMRFQDNFLFAHTADAGHNAVNHTASLLALALLASTVLALSALFLLQSRKTNPADATPSPATNTLPTLALLTALIAFLLVPLSTPLWMHLPNLAYLQFPWRLLTLLAPALALSLALLADALFSPGRTYPNRSGSPRLPAQGHWALLLLPLALSPPAYRLYAQTCAVSDTPAAIAGLLAGGHGAAPTDEYTPTAADNDVLRTGDPGYWLAPQATAPAPHTVATAAELDPNLQSDDAPVPLDQTLSTPAPHHLTLSLPTPEALILNLRDYPGWQIITIGPDGRITHPASLPRDDGLLAIALPAGQSTIDIAWHRSLDQTLGYILSALALLALALLPRTAAAMRTARAFRHNAPG